MTGYSADLERLDAGARDMKGFAGQATEIAGTLDRALAAFGACWGDDAVGRSFAASHEKPSGDASGALSGLSTALGDVSDKLAATAETYRHVEQSNASSMRRLDG
ncbi:Proteins of 100 residues with WXG [Lentzea waywayandensis]|uniref:Proteins of 100 residues with WXG n=1 Tax=Lentzea waywayandensis TaxID=84724 RepID=A0A1I6DXB3_9PSEU|nr:WXG100 family type VII secretion target [Lentzea waywayandensis]SFR10027.1 Proteins of 100 residues with WXG [Lentzea waywayandensis]